MRKRILISAGGTGGHLYPAMTVADELMEEYDLFFVGGGLTKSKVFDHQRFSFQEISCGTFKPVNFFSILRGIVQSRRIIKKFKPDAILGFGSYHTFPVLFAAMLEKIPIFLHEANSVPGKVNRFMSRFAETTGIHFPEAKKWLKGKTINVGMPLRKGYTHGEVFKSEARKYFALDPDVATILVFGGSQGARSINRHMHAAMQKHDSASKFQILHLTGHPDTSKEVAELYQIKKIPACVKEFESRMDLAWQAADLAVSRSGAGTVAEQVEFEVPAVLIPYPYATDFHQHSNAEFMVREVGGAVSISEGNLDGNVLLEQINSCLYHDRLRLDTMAAAIRKYKKERQVTSLCTVIKEYLNKESN